MRPEQDIQQIRRILYTRYPKVKTQLAHETAFQLLVATILSAQCTDKQVNAVTPGLFKNLKTPEDFATVPIERLEDLVRSTGFYKNKARNIKNCAQQLLTRFNGKVPDNIDDLVSLPGVGRKTANVVLGAIFDIPGIVVDTHVARISRRLDLTRQTVPEKIEFDLMELIPKEEWNDFCLRLIFFGREYCIAKRPKCPDCFLEHLCYSEDKVK